jgi:hypothetical protein
MKTALKKRKVAGIVTWQERREKMKGVCLNCHNRTHVDNFYSQFDQFVDLYNVKFARPAQGFMDDLKKTACCVQTGCPQTLRNTR